MSDSLSFNTPRIVVTPRRTPLSKRAFDLVAAAALTLAAAPLMAAVALAIRATSPGPALFRQTRVGKDGKTFRVFKFRTMVVNAEQKGLGLAVAHNDDRITKVGHLLRNTSLDELPQLFNVLRGEMSLVGPRPTVESQVARYTDFQRQRLLVRPGMTGWAQVNGRNSLSWERRIELDVWYVRNWSFRRDLSILFRTLKVVLLREGLYGEDGVARDLS